MNERINEFLKKLISFFPSICEEYSCSKMQYGEILSTVVIEDVFMPRLIETIKQNTNEELLQEIFEYFEVIANTDDICLKNIFCVTILESLGNEEKILKIAREYMGDTTFQLQIEADRTLGRI